MDFVVYDNELRSTDEYTEAFIKSFNSPKEFTRKGRFDYVAKVLANLEKSYVFDAKLKMTISKSPYFNYKSMRSVINTMQDLGIVDFQGGSTTSKGNERSTLLPMNGLSRFIESSQVRNMNHFEDICAGKSRVSVRIDGKPKILLSDLDEQIAYNIPNSSFLLDELMDLNDLNNWQIKDKDNTNFYIFSHDRDDLWNIKNHAKVFERLFHLNKGNLSHGRIYFPLQNIRKSSRDKIICNGERVTEIDFSGMHPNMILALNGERMLEDPYYLSDDLAKYRQIIKKACNILLNSGNNPRAVRNNLLKDLKSIEDRIPFISEKDDLIFRYEMLLRVREEGFIENIIDRLRAKYEYVPNFFSVKHKSRFAMTKDSEIMIDVIENLVSLRIPMLPIHDAILVPSSKNAIAEEVMKNSFKKVIGTDQDPFIKSNY